MIVRILIPGFECAEKRIDKRIDTRFPHNKAVDFISFK